jgi:GNAT superfamily N-acetyltransferase
MSTDVDHGAVTIRSFRPGDEKGVCALFSQGRLGGAMADNDTALDVEDIEHAYMHAEGNHFWVAQAAGGELVGMIGLQEHEAGAAEIRRLRVRPDYRGRGIGKQLLNLALQRCREREVVKITLDTFMTQELALQLLGKFHYHLDHTRHIHGRALHYFYLDLYEADRARSSGG